MKKVVYIYLYEYTVVIFVFLLYFLARYDRAVSRPVARLSRGTPPYVQLWEKLQGQKSAVQYHNDTYG